MTNLFSPPRRQDTKKTEIKPIPETTNRVATQVVDAAYRVHFNLGPGLLESVYEACLAHELLKRGITAERQVLLPIFYDGVQLDAGLRLDIVAQGGGENSSGPQGTSADIPQALRPPAWFSDQLQRPRDSKRNCEDRSVSVSERNKGPLGVLGGFVVKKSSLCLLVAWW